MARIAWAFLVAVALSCGPAPRNTAEFRQGVREGRGTTKHVRLEIERPFSDVFDDVKPRAEECFNHTKVRQRGHGTSARTEGTVTAAEMKTVAPDTGELVIKQHDAFHLVGYREVVLPGVGHTPQIEAPEQIRAALLELLTRH